MKPQIQLLISDLDNTLYDWVSFFVPAFYAMVDAAVVELEIDPDRLLDELRAVHQRYGSSEHPYALLETEVVQSRYAWATPAQKKEILLGAFNAFNATRRAELQLYDSVLKTLGGVRRCGTRVVAYTEAAVYTVVHRLELLGVFAEIDLLYAPAGTGEIGTVLGEPRPFPMHKIRLLPPDHKKPDPAVLLSICREQGIDPARALYVGDSLVRDVSMANRAGLQSAWARYGANYDPHLWKQLVRVTHWTQTDVAEEARLRTEFKDAKPDVELDSFGALWHAFKFEAMPDRSSGKTARRPQLARVRIRGPRGSQ